MLCPNEKVAAKHQSMYQYVLCFSHWIWIEVGCCFEYNTYPSLYSYIFQALSRWKCILFFSPVGCFGNSGSCCTEKVELFPDDKLILQSSDYPGSVGSWCDRVIIVRRNSDNYDECSDCSLTVQFVQWTTPFPATVELLQANYTTASYFSSEMLYLEPVVS